MLPSKLFSKFIRRAFGECLLEYLKTSFTFRSGKQLCCSLMLWVILLLISLCVAVLRRVWLVHPEPILLG